MLPKNCGNLQQLSERPTCCVGAFGMYLHDLLRTLRFRQACNAGHQWRQPEIFAVLRRRMADPMADGIDAQTVNSHARG